ncbi:MAG: SIMPL domain-containing protein [Pseudomonadota bacterium]|nr:SIMPL domain-containing protein [Pseudomonadota bacterium]
MKKTLIWIGTVIGAGAVMALVFGAINRDRPVRTISVNGQCLTTVKKDKVAITLRVTTLAPTAAESMKRATDKVAEITKSLETLPVEMQTTQFNSYEKTEWNRDEQKSITLGVETTIALEVSANGMTTIENVLGQFAGATDVYTENLRMYASPNVTKVALEKCLGVAVENARVRADALAQGDGMRVGKMLSVSYGTQMAESAVPTYGLMRTKMALNDAVAMDAAGTIVAKDAEVSVSVSAIFEIK